MDETNKKNLTIYKGSDNDYAYIPLEFTYDYYSNYAKNIINNDGNPYLKKINNNTTLSTEVKKQLNYALNNTDDTNTVNQDDTNNLKINMINALINLYYIENFTYVLDQDSYQSEDSNTPTNRDNYMFTINPTGITYDIENIKISEDDQDSGDSSTDTSTDTSTDNKTYNLIIDVPSTQQNFTLVQVGNTNTFKLNGNLIITYNQSDDTIKNDTATISNPSSSPSMFTFIIQIGSKYNTFEISQITNGYNTATNTWYNYRNIDLSDFIDKTYELTPDTQVSCNVQINIDKVNNPLFTKHGSKLINYTSKSGGYFQLSNITVPNIIQKHTVYFIQGNISNGYYSTWSNIISNVNTANRITINTQRSTSNIYIIMTPPGQSINASINLYSSSNSVLSTLYTIKSINKDYRSIFADTNTTDGTTEAPIFIYDADKAQTKVTSYIAEDNTVFDSYFTYSSNKKFTYNSSVKRNIVNIAKYYDIIYKYSNSKINHYCEDSPLTENDDLSQYIGYTFNVMIEKFNSNKNTIVSSDKNYEINDTLKQYSNDISEYQLQNKYDKIDTGTTTVYSESLYMYKLYSFKLSKTGDSNTGVYTYTT